MPFEKRQPDVTVVVKQIVSSPDHARLPPNRTDCAHRPRRAALVLGRSSLQSSAQSSLSSTHKPASRTSSGVTQLESILVDRSILLIWSIIGGLCGTETWPVVRSRGRHWSRWGLLSLSTPAGFPSKVLKSITAMSHNVAAFTPVVKLHTATFSKVQNVDHHGRIVGATSSLTQVTDGAFAIAALGAVLTHALLDFLVGRQNDVVMGSRVQWHVGWTLGDTTSLRPGLLILGAHGRAGWFREDLLLLPTTSLSIASDDGVAASDLVSTTQLATGQGLRH